MFTKSSPALLSKDSGLESSSADVGCAFLQLSEAAQSSICLLKPGHWCAVMRGEGYRPPHLPSDTSCVNYQVASASAWLNICSTPKVNAGEIYGSIFPRGKFAVFC